MFFLSGLPRSGSTLLGALLNQRSDTFVSVTSGLADTLGAIVMSWEKNPTTQASGAENDEVFRLLKATAAAKYSNRPEKYIFDKGRGWPSTQIMETMENSLDEPIKIIATVRPMNECMASFAKIAYKPDNPMSIKTWCEDGHLGKHLMTSYHVLKDGWTEKPENFLFIEYENLVNDPQTELDRISDFIGAEKFVHNFDKIDNTNQENDEAWDIKDLHKVREKIEYADYDGEKVIGPKLWKHYAGGEFWNDNPEPEKEIQLLDLQVQALYDGDYEEAKRIADVLEIEEPECNRAAFNRGWYKMKEGMLLEGHKLLDRGRIDSVFGNKHIGSKLPVWAGESDSMVILNLEAGLGDQIHGMRFVKHIKAKNNTVIASCSSEVADVVRQVEGVDIVCQHGVECGIMHDYWLPSMSSVVALNWEWENVDGAPYIQKPEVPPHKGFKIGLRWSGNPKFEHAQKRLFPTDLMFDAVKGKGKCISLQRDEGTDLRPTWMQEVNLDTFTDTMKAMSSCDLIITSCTVIAHLGGAMGIATWIVLPKICYYIWAFDGNKSPYYDSVTLFRQETMKNWHAPFEDIADRLKDKNLPQRIKDGEFE